MERFTRYCLLGLAVVGIVWWSTCNYAVAAADVQRSTVVEDVDKIIKAWDWLQAEDIHLSGEVRITTTTVRDAKGKYHLRLDTDYKVSGVGLMTGARYGVMHRIAENANTVDLTAEAPGEATYNEYLVLTTPGGGSVVRILSVVHATINANGSVTAYVDLFKLYAK